MENQRSNSSLKAIILVLSLLLVGSLTYMYKMSTDNEETEKKFVSEKQILLNELNAAKANYDAAIAENTGLKSDLETERAKIVRLIAEVEKSKGDNSSSIGKYQRDYAKLKGDMDRLLSENKTLRARNAQLTTERDSTMSELNDTKRFADTLVQQNDNLTKTVEKAAKLTILNLKTESFKEKSSGKLVSTERARRVDKLKISFTIAANEVAKAGTKMYYVQIIDAKNNVIGEKKTETFGGYTLTYSFITNVNYQNKNTNVSETLSGKDFEKGNYFVNVFDRDKLVANSNFTLK